MKVFIFLILLQQFFLFANCFSLKAVGTLTTYTAASGVVVESPHSYAINMNYFSENIVLGNGGYIAYNVQFDGSTETESGWDFVRIRVGSSTGRVIYSNSGTSFPPAAVYSDAGITFELSSDGSSVYYGLKCTVFLSTSAPTLQPTLKPTAPTLNPTLYPTLASVACDAFDVEGYEDTLCNFTICPMTTANASCSYSKDPPRLALFDSSGSQVPDVYHYNSTESLVVGITYANSTGSCEQFSLHQICDTGKNCSGSTLVSGASDPAPTVQPSAAPTVVARYFTPHLHPEPVATSPNLYPEPVTTQPGL